MPDRYEYKTVANSEKYFGGVQDIASALNELGAKGWRVIHTDGQLYVLERNYFTRDYLEKNAK